MKFYNFFMSTWAVHPAWGRCGWQQSPALCSTLRPQRAGAFSRSGRLACYGESIKLTKDFRKNWRLVKYHSINPDEIWNKPLIGVTFREGLGRHPNWPLPSGSFYTKQLLGHRHQIPQKAGWLTCDPSHLWSWRCTLRTLGFDKCKSTIDGRNTTSWYHLISRISTIPKRMWFV